jgi:hypothetical protein
MHSPPVSVRQQLAARHAAVVVRPVQAMEQRSPRRVQARPEAWCSPACSEHSMAQPASRPEHSATLQAQEPDAQQASFPAHWDAVPQRERLVLGVQAQASRQPVLAQLLAPVPPRASRRSLPPQDAQVRRPVPARDRFLAQQQPALALGANPPHDGDESPTLLPPFARQAPRPYGGGGYW